MRPSPSSSARRTLSSSLPALTYRSRSTSTFRRGGSRRVESWFRLPCRGIGLAYGRTSPRRTMVRSLPWSNTLPVGDAAVLIEFGQVLDVAANARVLLATRMAQRLLADGALPGVWGTIPSYNTLLIEFDPLATTRDAVLAALRSALMQGGDETIAGRRFRVPVWYAGEDLPEVAARTGLTVDEVITLHAAVDFRIFTVGFAPGQPICGMLPDALRLPRRGSPRVAVPPRSVALGGHQVTIYPTASPGGFHLLGRTPVVPFNLERIPPVLWAPGDVLRFYPIGREQYEHLAAAFATGEEMLAPEPPGSALLA
ncbi:allophanate hydrolase subunit 1 [bacterium]|nr:MAG: allophanate hydrolase subunit 1 [bacterium]